MKWEYIAFTITDAVFQGHHRHAHIAKILNIHGDQGWELIEILPPDANGRREVLMKRPTEGTEIDITVNVSGSVVSECHLVEEMRKSVNTRRRGDPDGPGVGVLR